MNEYAYNEQFENMEEESLRYINHFVTKQMRGLMLLLGSGSLSNKELAESLGKSPSNMSNLLDRMKKSKIPLLNISRQDKYMMYSLSPIALKYIKQYMETAEKKEQKVIYLHSQIQECLLALQKLRENVEEDFEISFNEKLSSYIERKKEEDQNDFYTFMECLEKLIITDCIKEFACVLEKFESQYLRNKIQEYFAKYIYIRRLCNINTYDWKMAYELIDSFFNYRCEAIGLVILKKYKDKIDVNEMIGITDCLKEINEEGKSMTKEIFLEGWNRYFSGHEQLLYYIAEKIVNVNR